MPQPTRLEPLPPPAPGQAAPELLPPCAGSWLRNEDGGLTPRDPQTAEAAGLAWPGSPSAEAEPAPEQEEPTP